MSCTHHVFVQQLRTLEGEEYVDRDDLLESGLTEADATTGFAMPRNPWSVALGCFFATARNHARYLIDGGQHDHPVRYLKSVKQW